MPISLEKLLENQLRYMSSYFDVTAISSNKERLEEFGNSQDVKTYHLNLTRQITPIQDLKAVWKLIKFLRKENPHIVHTHTPKAGIVGMMAAWFSRVPHRLHTVAGLPLMEATGIKRKILNLVEKLTYTFATKVYPNSKGLQEFIETEKFTKPSKLKIIGNGSSNGIDTQYFNPNLFSETQTQDLKKELGIHPLDTVFIFIGRIVADKGIHELIDAFQEFSSIKEHTKLILVGPLEQELDPIQEDTLHIIHTHPKIINLGFKKDIRPFLAISNVLVFPSYREGFPNVVLQASAMQLPCIVSNINGCNEIITHLENGLIIPVKNTQAITNAMSHIVNNKDLYIKMKTNSRPNITSNFERNVYWNALLKEYNTLN